MKKDLKKTALIIKSFIERVFFDLKLNEIIGAIWYSMLIQFINHGV